MADPYHHALSSSKRYGGNPVDYIAIHKWFDESKNHFADLRHRALRHHSKGIEECCFIFGDSNLCLRNSSGRHIPVRWIAEQHVIEDLGYIPTIKDWFGCIQIQPWMARSRKLSEELEND